MIAKNLSGKLLKFQKSQHHMLFQMFFFALGALCPVSDAESIEKPCPNVGRLAEHETGRERH